MTTIQSEKPRVLVLNCNRFDLATLADSLRLQGIDVVGQSEDIKSADQLFRTINPDSIVFVFQGCDPRFLELLNGFRRYNPSLGIVILTNSPDLRVYGIREGELPRGTQLIEKTALNDMREIRNAIDLSQNPEIKTAWIAHAWDASFDALTDIQIETLRLLASGLSNSDIGKARFVSEKSVEQTITRIAQHLHVVHEKGRNMRVLLATEYYKRLGTPLEHAI
jgi:DNA-binding NarL/FixJ family response regulator